MSQAQQIIQGEKEEKGERQNEKEQEIEVEINENEQIEEEAIEEVEDGMNEERQNQDHEMQNQNSNQEEPEQDEREEQQQPEFKESKELEEGEQRQLDEAQQPEAGQEKSLEEGEQRGLDQVEQVIQGVQLKENIKPVNQPHQLQHHLKQQIIQSEMKNQNQINHQNQKQSENQSMHQKNHKIQSNKLNLSNQKHINSLQLRLFTANNSIQEHLKKISEFKTELTNNKDTIRKVKMEIMESKSKYIKLDREHALTVKEKQKLSENNKILCEKLQEFIEAGDVSLLKDRIQNLQILVNAQREEIHSLKEEASLKQHQIEEQSENQFTSDKFLQHMTAFDDFNLKIKELEEKYDFTEFKNSMLQEQLDKKNQDSLIFQKEISYLQEKINEQIKMTSDLTNKCQNLQEELTFLQGKLNETKNMSQLQQKLKYYEQKDRLMEQYEIKIPKLKQTTIQEEKDILLRQYLLLQNQHEQMKQQQRNLKIKYHSLIRDCKLKESTVTSKKDYNELMVKYKKAKICLEGAFKQITQLEVFIQGNKHIDGSMLLHYDTNIIEESAVQQCQGLITTYTHKLSAIQDKTLNIALNAQLEENKIKYAQLIQEFKSNQDQYHHIQNLLQVYHDQITFKNNIIQEKKKYVEMLEHQLQEYKASENVEVEDKLKQVSRQNERLAYVNKVYEAKNIVIIKQNQKYLAQMDLWKGLYHSIKDKFQKSNSSTQETAKKIDMLAFVQQREQTQVYVCLNCEQQNKQSILVAQQNQNATQTEELLEFQFKETKQLLNVIKKIVKSVENVPLNIESTLKGVSETKMKYDELLKKYNGKFAILQKEKAENDDWRKKVREEIKEEFQDIRDLIANNKLVTALRQAKCLIEYFEELEGDSNKGSRKGSIRDKDKNEAEMDEEIINQL